MCAWYELEELKWTLFRKKLSHKAVGKVRDELHQAGKPPRNPKLCTLIRVTIYRFGVCVGVNAVGPVSMGEMGCAPLRSPMD